MAQPQCGAIKPLSIPTLFTSSHFLLSPGGPSFTLFVLIIFPYANVPFLHKWALCVCSSELQRKGKRERERERGGNREQWLSIPKEPSLEKSSSGGGKVINRSCTLRCLLLLLPCTSSMRSVNATSRHQSHIVRQAGRWKEEVRGKRNIYMYTYIEKTRKEPEASWSRAMALQVLVFLVTDLQKRPFKSFHFGLKAPKNTFQHSWWQSRCYHKWMNFLSILFVLYFFYSRALGVIPGSLVTYWMYTLATPGKVTHCSMCIVHLRPKYNYSALADCEGPSRKKKPDT